MSNSTFTPVPDGGSNINGVDPTERGFIPSEPSTERFESSFDNSHDIRDIVGREVPKIYKLGEKGTGVRLQGELQDFQRLRDACLSAGTLFEDPEFPALDSSIFVRERPAVYLKEIEWMRPKEIVDNPRLFVDGPSRFDPEQGIHSNDCWVISSLSTLAMQPKLLYKLLPPDQNFVDNYAGIFRVRFWQFGRWVEVVIDDRLPIYEGKLLCAHSSNKNEFWSSIIEKAYAKLHGYWEALEFGYTREAFEDFTGGMTQLWRIEEIPLDFFDILLEAYERYSLIGCIVEKKDDEAITEYRKSQGLVLGHAYSITKVMWLEKKTNDVVERIPLLRLRNPWGYKEWKGPWNDGSFEWNTIPGIVKEAIEFKSDDNDGEFWISFRDWVKSFDVVEICYLNLNYFMTRNYQVGDKYWLTYSFEGEWVIGASAGGSTDDLKNYQNNPQYRITLKNESTLIVSLMQKNRRTQRKSGSEYMMIGFDIYQLPEKLATKLPIPLDVDFFRANKPLKVNNFAESDTTIEKVRYFNFRQSSCRIKLPPGSYCIIPSTLAANNEGEFLLRVFSAEPINVEEYDDQIGEIEKDVPGEDSIVNGNEVKLKNVFRKLAGDDWEFDWREQKELLDCELGKELSKEGFSKDACRAMIALLDEDNTGKLGYNEFRKLWNKIDTWKAAFKSYDERGSGYLEPFELRRVLKSAGYRLNNRILNLLLRRYGTEDGHVKFDDYFMCAVKLNKIIDDFKERASPRTNTATLTMGEWIEAILKS